MSGATTGDTQQTRAKLRAQLEDAAREIVRLLELAIDRRVIERSSVTPTGRIDMERTERGTIGYQALRSHLTDAVVELLRRFYQGTRAGVEGDQAEESGTT
jgi:hypothetical protein